MRSAARHNKSIQLQSWYPLAALPLLALACLLFAPVSLAGDVAEAATPGWGTMAMNLLGGLALFLFGMEQMADALKAVAGERMKIVLAKLTTNRFMGALTGAFVTAIIQSSSVTTVLVVGFISAGLMSMAQSIGVIMGANIGTTITAQIVAFKVTKAALLMIAVGFAMLFFTANEKLKHYGGMVMGLGLIFFGMSVMSDAMYPLRTYQPFLDLMTHMENPLIGILVAALFTALVQSSSATTGIVIVMASQGFITLPAGIALAFGANIGTCVTALLASIGKPREAVRAAMVHVLFNVFGVAVWVGLIGYLAELVSAISPAHAQLSGTERLAADTPRQIANAHTIFNIANTLLFIGFTGQLARLVEWLVPDRPLEEEALARPRYLDDSLFETPSLALDRVRLEIGHIGDRVREMLERILPAILGGDRAALREIARIDDSVDQLHGHVVTYLGQISRKPLTEDQTHDFVGLMAAVNDLENIGDVIETDLVHLGNQRISEGVSISPSTRQVLTEVHHAVAAAAELAIRSVVENDPAKAREVIAMKEPIGALAHSAAMHQLKRLVAEEPNRLASYTIEMDIIEKLKRTYYFAKRMAKNVDRELEEHAEAAGAAA
ncbi:MAG: Na/Pi cotransporter family protein [Pseudomonadota bacterium]